MKGFTLIGWGAIIFGILVLLLPQLLADLVAIFFIVVGINLLIFGRRIHKV
jgi:hypothetical protein